MSYPRPVNPCFHYCKIDPDAGRCNGCGHNYDEILLWCHLPQERREAAEREAQEFLTARGGPDATRDTVTGGRRA